MNNINELDLKELKKIATQGYGFYWSGKGQAVKDAENNEIEFIPYTENNMYIEGDNIIALKMLQKEYEGKIKMIYIDPPYNTGKKFIYNDKYQKKTGKLSYGDGRHSDWLNMMYPRLSIARDLLTEDGVIFISLDDIEIQNLRKICDEIFGEYNFISTNIWVKKKSPQNDAKKISPVHDYVLCYCKNINNYKMQLLIRDEKSLSRFKNLDNDPRGAWSAGDLTSKTKAKDHSYPISSPSGKVFYPTPGRQWAPSLETYKKWVSENRIWFGIDGDSAPKKKQFLSEIQQGIVPTTLWESEIAGNNTSSSRMLKELDIPFDSPKPIELLKHIMNISLEKDETNIILDFFSGSATTAHAVMQLNAEDNGNRKFIMVQLPEPTPNNSEASKLGYKNICEIGKERIRRAGEKIKADESLPLENREKLNTDFEVIKL